MAQRAGVQQLVRVDTGDGAAGDVAHVVHATLQSTGCMDIEGSRGSCAGPTLHPARARRDIGPIGRCSAAFMAQAGPWLLKVVPPEATADQAPRSRHPGASAAVRAVPTMKEVRPRCCRPAMMVSASSSVTPRSCRGQGEHGMASMGTLAATHCAVRELPRVLPSTHVSDGTSSSPSSLPECWRGW